MPSVAERHEGNLGPVSEDEMEQEEEPADLDFDVIDIDWKSLLSSVYDSHSSTLSFYSSLAL